MKRPRHLIQSARHLRQNMTEAEWELWDMLRGDQCQFRFRRQHPIPPYVVDFYCSELRLVIEVDGGQHGGESDMKRDAVLKEKGYRILRFWNNDVLSNIDGVWEKIAMVLNDLSQLPRVTPTLTLPLKGEGKSRKIFILPFVLFLFLFVSLGTAHAENNEVYNRIIKNNTIRCGYYVWPPFMTKDVNTGEMGGMAYDWFQEVGKQLAMRIEWVSEINLDTAFEGYSNGRYDMICAPLIANPARSRASDFTIPVVYGSYNLYARIDDKRFDHHFEKINDPGVKYASVEGDMNAILGRELFPLAQKIDISQVGANTDVFMQVAMGKADLAAMEPVSAWLFIKNNPNKIRLVEGGPVRTMPFSFSIPQGEEKLKSMLNITLQTLLDIGAIDRVLKKYPDYDATLLRIPPSYQPPSTSH